MIFYLGTHEVHWLGRTDVPLFISRRRLAKRKTMPRARGPWALDSGGFTELTTYGRWTIEPAAYVDEVRRYQAEIGRMDWAVIQDWMCEPVVIRGGRMGKERAVGTGLSVEEHQRRTVQSYLDLSFLADDLPWTPVLQGWEIRDYIAHLEMYDRAGVDLRALPVVGVGSVCRRQATEEAETLIRTLEAEGIRVHGFGFKTGGLLRCGPVVSSADSMAWSYHARKNPHKRGTPACTHKHCGNCLPFALNWRAELLARLTASRIEQEMLAGFAEHP